MKVKITLPDGKLIELEGTPEELKQLDVDFGKSTPLLPNPFPWMPNVPLAPPFPSQPNPMSPWEPLSPSPWEPIGTSRTCIGPCNPECYACNGRPWLSIYPPPCICSSTFTVRYGQVQIPNITLSGTSGTNPPRQGDIVHTTGYITPANGT